MGNNYLDKVVDQIVRETRIDYSVGIFTPFREFPFQITISDSRFFSSPSPPASFTFHLTEVYSISEWGEITYLWDKYVKTLRDKIEGNDGVINESNGMNNNYLDKVLKQIVSETKIDYRGRGKIFTPFTTFTFPSLYIFYYRSNFTKHCKEVYGLNEQEIEYIWKEYRDIIKDKIS